MKPPRCAYRVRLGGYPARSPAATRFGVVPTPPIVTLFANGMLATAPGAGVVAVAVSVPFTAVSSQDPVKDELYGIVRPYCPGAMSPAPPPRKDIGNVKPLCAAVTLVPAPAGATLIAPKNKPSPGRKPTVLAPDSSRQAFRALQAAPDCLHGLGAALAERLEDEFSDDAVSKGRPE
jgi:hypothetical protein